ncbi:MAG: response regulator transcription factor [Streptomycetaceae bacterium]|nr:response regulator transcription factor [Streptomycetaceae bacterium]
MYQNERGPVADRSACRLRTVNTAETAMGIPIRIAVVDDHALFREGLREILRAEEGFAVVGEAADHPGALQVVGETRPDVVLLDADLCGLADNDVVSTVRAMLATAPHTRVIVMSLSDQSPIVQSLLSMGARGYLLKSATRYDLIAAVRSVMADDERVVISITRSSLTQGHAPSRRPCLLSAREREVISLVAQGLTNGQAGRQLCIAEGTVKHHLRNVFSKLGATCRVDAVNKAIAWSLIDPPSHSLELSGLDHAPLQIV